MRSLLFSGKKRFNLDSLDGTRHYCSDNRVTRR